MTLYTTLLRVAALLGLPLIIPWVLLSAKRRKTVPGRLGLGNPWPRLPQRPIWIHALSVGEVLSAAPLANALSKTRGPGGIVFSVSTLTGLEVARKTLPLDPRHIFFFPYDFKRLVRKAVGVVRPRMAVIVETDVWPHFMGELKRRRVPAVWVNARLSERSFRGYGRFRWFFKPLFSTFSKIAVQTREDARRFTALGVDPDRIRVAGNLKFHQDADSGAMAGAGDEKARLGLSPGRKVFVAGSVHRPEEAALADVFKRLRGDHPDLFMIAAPRDPSRAGSLVRLLRAGGFRAGPLSEDPGAEKRDAVVVDQIGVLRRLYAAGDAAFIGGSLARRGGHNPLEPAAFGKPAVFGPDMSDFAEISRKLLESGGAFAAADAREVYEIVSGLLADEKKARAAGKKAREVFDQNQGALDRVLEIIETAGS
ncbi:conserved hypothetical protein [Candidatus Desulfarcum epimagneticum]|uniref:3-deoxy-D-manno-octulosonic acid transferase n=1 Tax=uncultured Desulfobacteraceae bacterium TaxID=218296 RepID=A0A484HLU9_9BACT|nr:conserved hypothetical protein [uncultured Desulfobacteraceae bacterium]